MAEPLGGNLLAGIRAGLNLLKAAGGDGGRMTGGGCRDQDAIEGHSSNKQAGQSDQTPGELPGRSVHLFISS